MDAVAVTIRQPAENVQVGIQSGLASPQAQHFDEPGRAVGPEAASVQSRWVYERRRRWRQHGGGTSREVRSKSHTHPAKPLHGINTAETTSKSPPHRLTP